MALTTQQLLYINNLLYSNDPSIYGSNPQTSYEGRTLGELVESINPSGNACSTASAQEWANMKEQILSDPQLKNIQVKDAYIDKSTGDAGCLLVDPSTNEAVVAFRGTGGGEWKDNFIAGSTMDHGGADPTISVQQQKALDYVESLNLEQYDSVTMTGHSKGGNKAKICTLLNDEVDRCVSFDGQGFSDEFMDAHSGDVAANQHKIQNHNVDGDYVNLLLNDVGETQYYEGQRTSDNFVKNHDPATFLTNDGRLIPTDQKPEMKEMDRFLNSLLRSVDGEQKKDLLDFAGEACQSVLGFDGSPEKMMEVLLDPRNADEASYFLAYMIKYEHETGKITDSVIKVLDGMGMQDYSKIVSLVNRALTDEDLYGIVKAVSKFGDDIPDWLIRMAADKLREKGVDLSAKELKQILKIAAMTGEKLDSIHIVPNSGEDIKVPGAPDTHSSGQQPQYQNVDTHTDISFTGNEGMYIFVHFSELLSCCDMLNAALEDYRQAVETVRMSAEDLASKWEGATKDAFVTHQQSAFRWYGGMAEVVDAVIRMIRKLHDFYTNTESSVTKLMQGR